MICRRVRPGGAATSHFGALSSAAAGAWANALVGRIAALSSKTDLM